jgi:hypothetical protein
MLLSSISYNKTADIIQFAGTIFKTSRSVLPGSQYDTSPQTVGCIVPHPELFMLDIADKSWTALSFIRIQTTTS